MDVCLGGGGPKFLVPDLCRQSVVIVSGPRVRASQRGLSLRNKSILGGVANITQRSTNRLILCEGWTMGPSILGA